MRLTRVLSRVLRTTGVRLAALYAGLFGLSVIVLFVVIYWITDNALRHQVTAAVSNEVVELVGDYRAGGLSRAASAITRRMSTNVGPTTFYLLLDSKGGKIAGNLPAMSPREGWQEFPIKPSRRAHADGDARDPKGHRVLALGTGLADGAFLVVGQDIYRITEVEEAIVRAFGGAFGVTLLLAAVGGGILSIGFLRRVDSINRTTRAIVEGNLADRVPTRGTDDELDHLAINLNEMLDRVQALMESLRQVSNDIAHDLRTPLTRLRQRLEETRVNAQRIDGYRTAVDQAIADTDAILETFSALLRIAQIEAGTRKAGFSTLDLSGVFGAVAEAYEAVAEDSGRTLSASIAPDISFLGDRELLTQMLVNLVENAIRHTPEGTSIDLTLEQEFGRPVASVADNGPGIPAEVRDKVFRRFFRLERSRSTKGSGLGLSLVAAVAEIHGIAITILDNDPGLRVRLEFSRGRLT